MLTLVATSGVLSLVAQLMFTQSCSEPRGVACHVWLRNWWLHEI